MGREGEREWLTWWAERCRWGVCGAVCFSRTGMQPECCEGCLRRWSCPRWSTPPDRLMPHGCSGLCSTVTDERCDGHRIWLSSVKNGCDETKKCLWLSCFSHHLVNQVGHFQQFLFGFLETTVMLLKLKMENNRRALTHPCFSLHLSNQDVSQLWTWICWGFHSYAALFQHCAG